MNMLNSWIFWVVIYIISGVVFDQTFKKVSLKANDMSLLTVLIELFAAIFAILFIPLFNINFPAQPYIYFILLFVAILYAFVDRLNIEVRYGLEPSTFSMLKQISTVFLLILGVVMLNESIGFKKVIGALLITISNILLAFNKTKFQVDKYFIMSLVSNLLFSFAMIINIKVSDFFNLGMYTVFTLLFPAIFIFLFSRNKVKNLIKEFKAYDKKQFVLAAFCWSVMLISSVRAYQLNSISVVAPILASTAIVNAIVEYFSNKDSDKLLKKIILFIIILIGIILVKA